MSNQSVDPSIKNVEPDLYFLIRRISDEVDPKVLLNQEIPMKYPKSNAKDNFQRYARLVTKLNPDDFDYSHAETIKTEQRLIGVTQSINPSLSWDEDSPITPEEHGKIARLHNCLNQKHFFKDRNGMRGSVGGGVPVNINRETLEKLKKYDPTDSEFGYLDDIGKHLYVHHGWQLGDFQAHPTARDRQIACNIEHEPLLGTILPGGVTHFDEMGNNTKQSSRSTRIPCFGKVSPNNLELHMTTFHGHTGNEEDHHREHENGVSNHTHPSR